MFGIFCYFYDQPNLIYPYHVVGVKVNEKNKEGLYELLSNLLNLAKLNLHSKSNYERALTKIRTYNANHKALTIYIREIGKLEIEKNGIRKAFYNQVNYLSNFYPVDTILVGACSSSFNALPDNVIYSPQYNQNLELTIGFIYSKAIRLYYLNKYHSQYPELDINKHKGNLTKSHFNKLLELDYLPSFYIESEVIQHLLLNKNITKLPLWAQSYIENNYDPIIK